MANITDIDIINTINGPVEVRAKATTHIKTQESKIVVTVVRHPDPVVARKTASITVKSINNEDIEKGKQQARNRLATKINTYYLGTLPAAASLIELYDAKLAGNSSTQNRNSPWYYICPTSWGKDKTRELRLKYFYTHFLKILSDAVLRNAYGPSVDEEIRQHILDEVKRNIFQKEKNKEIPEEMLDVRAKNRANEHLAYCNDLYSAFRLELSDYLRFPEVYVPLYDVERMIRSEQCKALPWEMLIILAALLGLYTSKTPLALGGILMMVSLLRTAEATAPTFGDLVIRDGYAVYGVLWQADGSVRVADLKTDSAYRLIIIPTFGLDFINARKDELRSQGISEDAIKHAYVVSDPEDPFRPANPNALSAFVRKLLTEIGCSNEYWAAAAELMHKEPDILPTGQKLSDLTCYLLRRSGCTFLCNCTGLDPRIVDVIMGHLLRREDEEFVEDVKREEFWDKIADHMECIVYDPEHSAHPAYSPKPLLPADPKKVSRPVAHTRFKVSVTEEMIQQGSLDLVVTTLDVDDVFVTFPDHAEIIDADVTPIITPSDYPCINEHLVADDFVKCKAIAAQLFEKLTSGPK